MMGDSTALSSAMTIAAGRASQKDSTAKPGRIPAAR